MEVTTCYVVYEMVSIMGNGNYKAMREVEFDGFVANDFASEKDAIQALIDDKKTYDEFFILRKVYIRT